MRKAVLATAAVLATMGLAYAADWPQFYGPQRNGVSPETGLATTWPTSGPKELWKLPVGPGFGGVAVEGGKVYLLDRVENKQEVLRCVDLSSGKEAWTCAYAAAGRPPYEGSRSTPSVDDKYVFTVGATGEVLCVDKATHQPLWQKNLIKTYGGKLPNWFVSQSPLLYKDMVIIAPQSDQACLAALKKADGQEVWKSSPLGAMQYASPLIATVEGFDQVVMLTRKGKGAQVAVAGVDPADGKTLWTYDGWGCDIPIPSPTYVGGGRFFINGGYNAGCVMFKVSREGDKWTVSELFKNKTIVNSQLHNAILFKDHLYINGNYEKQQTYGLVCMDLEGNLKWSTQNNPGIDLGGLVLADGLLYVMDGKSGTLAMVQASPEGYKELARAKVLSGKGGMIWGPMALADGKLLCRDQRELKCLDIKNP